MRKFLTLLMLLVSILCFAQKDTIFVRESEMKKEHVMITIPDSVVNPTMSLEDNGFVFFYKKEISMPSRTKEDIVISFSKDIFVRCNKVFYFDEVKGKNLIKIVKTERVETFPWTALFFFLVNLAISLLMVLETRNCFNNIKPRSVWDILGLSIILFVVYMIYIPARFALNVPGWIPLIICFVVSILFYFFWLSGAFNKYVTKKNIFIFILIQTIIFLPIAIFVKDLRTVGVSILIGMYVGVALFYLWFLWKNWKLFFPKNPKKKAQNPIRHLSYQVHVPPRARS